MFFLQHIIIYFPHNTSFSYYENWNVILKSSPFSFYPKCDPYVISYIWNMISLLHYIFSLLTTRTYDVSFLTCVIFIIEVKYYIHDIKYFTIFQQWLKFNNPSVFKSNTDTYIILISKCLHDITYFNICQQGYIICHFIHVKYTILLLHFLSIKLKCDNINISYYQYMC